MIINTIIGNKPNNIDETIKINFANKDIIRVTENFALSFKQNVTFCTYVTRNPLTVAKQICKTQFF